MEENRTVEHGCEKELLASLRNVSKIFKSDLAGLFETVSDPIHREPGNEALKPISFVLVISHLVI